MPIIPSRVRPSGAVLELGPKVIRKSTNLVAGRSLRTRSPKSSTGVGTPAASRNTAMSKTVARLATRPAAKAASAETSNCFRLVIVDGGAKDSAFLLRDGCVSFCKMSSFLEREKVYDADNSGHARSDHPRIIHT